MKIEAEASLCPLCRSKEINVLHEDRRRIYLRCCHCLLVFVPDRYWLSVQEEKAIYDLHENNSLDQGYRRFLSRLHEPLQARLKPQQRGLDFGCGPGPALAGMFKEQGQQVELYDPFYFNDPSLLKRSYDFICATEVVEHLRAPAKEFSMFFDMLESGAWLGLMTKLVTSEEAFRNWHYIRDPTHICFYSQPTFEYIAKRFTATVEYIGSDVILLMKK